MIIFGYPGIGKTLTYEANKKQYIDLDSYIFNKKLNGGWVPIYFKLAEAFSELGRDVFVSTHEEVIRYFKGHSKQPLLLIYPSIYISKEWAERLYLRYKRSGLESDYKAWTHTVNQLYLDIGFFNSYTLKDIPFVELNNMNYNLHEIIQEQKNKLSQE